MCIDKIVICFGGDFLLTLWDNRVERCRSKDRGAEGAEGDGVWGGGVPSPQGEGSREGA